MPTSPDIARDAAVVLDHALGCAPTLGAGRLICVDGPAGSGKTTLGEAIARLARRRVTSVRLLHMDDMYEGWAGLGDVATRIRDGIIDPLLDGRTGSYRRWDWFAHRWAEEHHVDPVPLLVIEGVGSGSLELADAITTLVWVEAPADLRLARGVERDGESMRADWLTWRESETKLFTAHRTADRADIFVDGTGATPARLC